MEEKNRLELLVEENQKIQILKTNQYAAKYGLSLSEEQVQMIVKERKKTLKEQKRVEFGESILPKIIYTFCDSAYIFQDNYAETLIRLQEIFFLYKNEMQDEISDDELLTFMKEQFETVCFGDLDYLEGTCLEIFAQAVRGGYRGYRTTEGRDEYRRFDEIPRWDKEMYLEVFNRLCKGE